jgi:hypothetical protein
MYRPNTLSISVAALLLLGEFSVGESSAQQSTKTLRERLVGTWLVTAADNVGPDGSRFQAFGPNPKGIMMFDANGWFSVQLGQSGRPKFASDNRLQGTAEENKTTVEGSLSYYGNYYIDEEVRVLHLYIESSSWPNLDGIENKRIITSLSDDELKWHSPAGYIGTTDDVVWKRAK